MNSANFDMAHISRFEIESDRAPVEALAAPQRLLSESLSSLPGAVIE
jgi:hypothetical protein